MGKSHHSHKAFSLPDLESMLGYRFVNRELLEEALNIGKTGSERRAYDMLEKEGDYVLSLGVLSLLRARYPQVKVGEITRMETILVRNANLAHLATRLHLPALLKQESRPTFFSEKLLADVVEAIFGAIARDSGAGDICSGLSELRKVLKRLLWVELETAQVHQPYKLLEREIHNRFDEGLKFSVNPIWFKSQVIGYAFTLRFGSKTSRYLGVRRFTGTGHSMEAAREKAAAVSMLKLEAKRYPSSVESLANFSWKLKKIEL